MYLIVQVTQLFLIFQHLVLVADLSLALVSYGSFEISGNFGADKANRVKCQPE